MLSGWQWAIVAAIPPAMILLYFLKLKRQPLEVPSTYLWHRSIEDLHVNSIWQRLRRNLLLFLQLLLLLIVILALLQPSWKGRQLTGDRFIFLVDNSASMNATDVGPSRLDDAKAKVGELIEKMKSGDVAMIVSFADSARVEQMFTDDRNRLRRALHGIRPTQRSTSLLEALRVASGLANPGRSSEDDTDYQVAEALPADLYVLSDGQFTPPSFSLGNLEPTYVPIGLPDAANVGIMALSVRRGESNPELFQAFARLKNFADQPVQVSVDLLLHDELIDASELEIGAGEEGSVVFPLGAIESGVLKLKARTDDDLADDDEACVVVNPPRLARVLLVTTGDEPLEFGLQTELTKTVAEVTIEPPEFLKKREYLDRAAAGAYDLVIYDRCAPPQMPQANTLLIGSLPPVDGWASEPLHEAPVIIDVETGHPLLQWMDLGDVLLLEGTPLRPPASGAVLIDSDAGPMFAIAPREGFEDAVMGFVLLGEQTEEDGTTARYVGTNWHSRQSFPVFVLNLLDYFGGGRGAMKSESVRPTQPVVIEAPSPGAKLRVLTPGGDAISLSEGRSGKFSFTRTAESGVYEVQSDGKTFRRFAVNLFDPAESEIRPKEKIDIGWVPVEAQTDWEVARREIWKWLLLLGLVVLLLEWYIYNRRVYL
ncbi:MAG: BatA and WFA domain-containing protein [Pirellulales bacterium]|nr:BatA and WFA domain-containing protein [Pirellulales bacterium]